jgi:dipeptidyl aminopeptidase/acylaminoacyl peptidase
MVRSAIAAAATVLLAAPCLSCAQAHITNAAGKRELTPADAIATVRFMQNQLFPGERSHDSIHSPDGHRYVIRLAYGDVERNGVWLDLRTGSLDTLDAAAHPKLCAHLFTTGLGSLTHGQSADADPTPSNMLRWLDATHVAFLWSNSHGNRQVLSVDLQDCRHRFLTQSPTDVFAFARTADGTLLVNTQIPRHPGRSRELWNQGFTIQDGSDAWSIAYGDIDGTNSESLNYHNRWFISAHGIARPLVVEGRSIDVSNPFYREVSLSPDGHYAVIGTAPAATPRGWDQYQSPTLQRLLKTNEVSAIRSPLAYTLIDVETAASRPLWNSPKQFGCDARWSPEGNTVLLAPTFLPLNALSSEALGVTGAAAAVVDVRTGRFDALPVDLTDRTVVNAQWISAAEIQLDSTDSLGADARSQFFTRTNSSWHSIDGRRAASPGARSSVRLEIRQTLNSPPQVFAVDNESGAERRVFDPNPDLLTQFKLGRVERLSGTLPNGQQWIAQLTYPAEYQSGHRYALVIQSLYGHGFGSEEFTLNGFWGADGMGLGPSADASSPGQLLATRNIAVLELAVLHPHSGPGQAEDYKLAYETLAEQLSTSGLVDRNRVALDGFSRNGYWVEYTLSHSKFPFAAAVVADNYDPSYIQSALADWRPEDERLNGGPAFGDGLQVWLANTPGFNAEHIHAPLLMIGQSAGLAVILSKWETFSRLRHLHRPVEMYLMPHADMHPSHTPQNPQQILAIQSRIIDWLDFWLTGREDPSPEKRAQYLRWRTHWAALSVTDP